MDPAIMPAVGTPEPGGLNWAEMLALLRAVIRTPRGGVRPGRAVPDSGDGR
jgi:arginase family enzyme